MQGCRNNSGTAESRASTKIDIVIIYISDEAPEIKNFWPVFRDFSLHPVKMMRLALPPVHTDFRQTVFPPYVDTLEHDMDGSKKNRMVDQVIRTPGREPSPQPTHFTVPSNTTNGFRVIRSATVGYIAPKFSGKDAQIEEGNCIYQAEVLPRLDTNSIRSQIIYQ